MCQRHNRDMKDFGFSSALSRAAQVSHAGTFSGLGVLLVSMAASLQRADEDLAH